MAEQRCAVQIIVNSLNCISLRDVTVPHEGRFVIWLENERLPKVQLRYVLVRIVSLSVVVDEDTAHTETAEGGWILLRIFKKNERTGVPETDIAGEAQAFGKISASNLSTGLVLLLLRATNFVEREGKVEGKLQGGPVPRTSFLLREPGLVLLRRRP